VVDSGELVSGRQWRVVRGGRRWKDFGVDGERKGKFGGKLGGTKMRKWGYELVLV
jgi:hypothetical protein